MKRVLVVDDMAVIREALAACLKAAGFEAETAGDGIRALAAMRSHRPDLVLLDLAMPGMDGVAVLRAMKAAPALCNIPVLLLSGVTDKRIIIEVAQLGVEGYLLKSDFSSQRLLERVNNCLQPRAPTKQVTPQPPAASPAAAGVPATASPATDRSPLPTTPTIAATTPAPAAPTAAVPQRSTTAGAPPAGVPSAAATKGTTPACAAPLTETDLPVLLTREQCVARVEEALEAKTLPGVVLEVVHRASSPRTDLTALANLIGRDSLLSAKVLHAANSAAYASSRGTVTTLTEAVRNIGCGTVRDLAASLGIFETMPEASDASYNPLRCWQHSLAVAGLCERLAAMSDKAPPGLAYLVGLCHDLGEILFHTRFGAEYRQVCAAQLRTALRRDAVERAMLGITHHELVAVILQKLGLPDTIRQPIEAFLSPGRGGGNPLASLLWLANLHANGLTLCESDLARVAPVARSQCRALTGANDPPLPDANQFRSEIMAVTTVLARLTPAQERELGRPLFQPSPVRIHLVRDPAFSATCPLANALTALGQVTVSERPPTTADLANSDRIVIACKSLSSAPCHPQQVRSWGPERVLWLVGKAGDEQAVAPAQLLPYPVALADLGRFVTPAAAAQAA
jgi:HD-like signal output (HDOD) protein/CheY-like chemotaxis protein